MKNTTLAPQISLLPPPGPSVLTAGIRSPSSNPINASIPPLFLSALEIRIAVFVKEQSCPAENEIDADDAVSWHWVLSAQNTDREDVPAATIRLVPAQTHAHAAEGPNYAGSSMWTGKEAFLKIGRLATIREFRGRGYGRLLVDAALEWAGRHGGELLVKGEELGEWRGLVLAHAQKGVEGWYAGMGWEKDEGMGTWLEEEIEHVGMWKRVEVL